MTKYNRRYNKTKNAQNLFPKLDIAIVAEKCPYLKKMLDELVAMAVAAGATLIDTTEGQ